MTKIAIPKCKKCGKQHYPMHPCGTSYEKPTKTFVDKKDVSGQPLVKASVRDTQKDI